VRQLTNLAGAVTDTYAYDAFGNLLGKTGSTPNSYLYRGEQYDSDLGLYYLRARYYNPTTGRFLSRDPNDPQPIDPDHQLYDAEVAPIDLKALHKYLYAGGDPVNTIDPRGRAEEAEDAGANLESVEEAIDNLKSIEKAQQRVRSGADGGKRIIDVIQKSFDRVDNLLDDIVRGKIDPGDL
jgi:RHS repeat-associated protein